MRNAGLEIYPELMGHGYYIPETAQYYVSNFIAAGATAILCGSDTIAKGVISECQLHGFNVPNDISVVGFDDVKFAAALTPPLTTVRQECNDLGRCAYIILNSLIHHIPISRTQLRPRLIERELLHEFPPHMLLRNSLHIHHLPKEAKLFKRKHVTTLITYSLVFFSAISMTACSFSDVSYLFKSPAQKQAISAQITCVLAGLPQVLKEAATCLSCTMLPLRGGRTMIQDSLVITSLW